jgi:hypothetical protein
VKSKLFGILSTILVSAVCEIAVAQSIDAYYQFQESVSEQEQTELLEDIGARLANPLVELKTATVTCATSATQIKPSAAGKSMMIINTTSTAVYVGGTNVDGSTAGTTGVDVCDGCTAGKTLSVDSREAYCVVASGTQAIEILYGVQ